ncbi:MAG: hypothetical protein HRU70_05595 [Phycisphaeraceae bacterium]|nr:MAG: hypothetical protein HRU70_05595 [Phycisphaeraceae bacterium]
MTITLGISALVKLVQVDGRLLLFLLGGVVVVALVLGLYRAGLMLADRAKRSPFTRLIRSAAGAQPAGVADPAKRARLDDLRRNFEEGIEKFRAAGKDLYALPWYLLVGPAGSGKTEAMRHCKVGFPPGLQDFYQGTGGTVNMHWWFTNHAVVLDTAGRIFMERAALEGGSEWREFLKLLRKSRPNAPVNGMLLVIGVDSLIKDTEAQIEEKAGHIARQLDTIQRSLDARFPVYVIITKCDLIPGFREFFDKVEDPQLQHQMLGWSNPAPLDEPFRAEEIDTHLEAVRGRLRRRRATLLLDPVHTVDPQARRTDQVDELFALPDNIARLTPRLKRYLETIFQAGEWSPKPLFLRGIYFTSSMREGQALDGDLAQALGVPVDRIPGGKAWDRERSYFLRDLFMSKVFREKGLVTRATNVKRQISGRRRLVLGGAIAVAGALLALTLWSNASLRASVKDPAQFWSAVSKDFGEGGTRGRSLALFGRDASGRPWYMGEEAGVTAGGERLPRWEVLRRGSEYARRGVPVGFFQAADAVGDINRAQREGAEALIRAVLVGPLLREVRRELVEGDPATTPPVGVLARLMKLEASASLPSDQPGRPGDAGDVSALIRALTPTGGPPEADVAEVMNGIPAERWLTPPLAGTTETTGAAVEAVARLGRWWSGAVDRARREDGEIGRWASLGDGLAAFADEAARVGGPFLPGGAWAAAVPPRPAEYDAAASAYGAGAAKLAALIGERRLVELASSLGDSAPDAERATSGLLAAIEADRTTLTAELPSPTAGRGDTETVRRLREAVDSASNGARETIAARAGRVIADLSAEPARGLLARATSGRGFEAVAEAYRRASAGMVSMGPVDHSLSFGAFERETASANAARESALSALSGATGAVTEAARAAVTRSSEVALAGLGGAALARAVGSIPEAGRWEAAVAERAATGRHGPVVLPAVAMTARVAGPGPDAFHPGGASEVFAAWGAVGRSLDERGPVVVGKDELRRDFERTRAGAKAYAEAYAAAWQREIDAAKFEPPASWDALAAAVAGMNPVEQQSALARMIERAAVGLAAMASALGDDTLASRASGWSSLAGSLLDAEGSALALQTHRTLVLLASARSTADARRVLLSMPAERGRALDTVGISTHPGAAYWRGAAGHALTLMASAHARSIAAHEETLAQRLGFPLLLDSEVAMPPDTIAPVLEAAKALNALAPAAVPGVEGEFRADHPFADALRSLSRPPASMTTERSAALARLVSAGDVIAASAGATVRVSTWTTSDAPAGLTRDDHAREVAGDTCAVTVAGREVYRGKFDTGGQSLGAVPFAGEGFRLGIIDTERAGNEVGAWEARGWAGLRLATTDGLRPAGAGAADAPLVFEALMRNDRRGRCFVWVRLDGVPALPERGSWPRRADFPGSK